MTIEYDKSQKPEVIARKIYDELIDLPVEIRKDLQKLIYSTPIIKTSYLVEDRKYNHSHFLDVSDLLDFED